MKTRFKLTNLMMALVMVAGAGALYVSEIGAQGTTYKIGDKGPAGGWIFYDKGNNSGGWRYLEAAPVDQGSAEWGCYEKIIPGATSIIEIGTGKANTAAIIKGCQEPGIAAKVAAAYRGGGKSDWFLPSKDELFLMYTNLHKAGIGGFAAEGYWSSSEYSNDPAWTVGFYLGSYSYEGKFSKKLVRAARAF